MFSYALKRIIRGRSAFLALFLSVAVAATLFSGILQGADAVGASMLSEALEATDIDIVSSAEDRNLTRTSLAEVEEAIGALEHVSMVEHLIRSVELVGGAGIEVSVEGQNGSLPFTIVSIASDSRLVGGMAGVERLEDGVVYVDVGSVNSTIFHNGDPLTLKVPTYLVGGNILDIQNRYLDVRVGGVVDVDDRLYSIAMGRYGLFLRALLIGSGQIVRREPHNLMFMSEETFLSWMRAIYAEHRRHTRVLVAETVISLDRAVLLNAWDIQGSGRQVQLVFEKVNSLGARFGYVPQNYLGELLDAVDLFSSRMKTGTMLVAAPVFFTAWYLGSTVSEISLGLRRREIGLLFTRGLTQSQVLYMFLFEALLVSFLSGAAGVLLGAVITSLVMPGIGAAQVFGSASPLTVGVSFAFSCSIALVAMYWPAKRALGLSIVDALREHRGEEEVSGSWHEPALALSLGAYRVVMLVLGLTVEQFRPETSNLVVFVLYSTWWGVDYILTYIAPILFFWGATTLFIQHQPWFHVFLDRLARLVVGDAAQPSTLSVRRNPRRTAAAAFMAALILGYSVSVIGAISSTDDYTERFTRLTVGADASVWLFKTEGAEGLADEIRDIEGVESATQEAWFDAESSLGVIPVRMIDPAEWGRVAYIEPDWIGETGVFERMAEESTNAIMERGAAWILGATVGSQVLIKLGDRVHTFTVVGLFGREPGPGWTIQDPTLYIPKTYDISEKYFSLTRILVKLEGGADASGLEERVRALDPNVEGVDVAEALVEGATANIFLAGPRRVEEMGVYFAALVSSMGVIVVIWTTLMSRSKEITVMAIRGFSARQLSAALVVENLGTILFSVALGLGVGMVMLRGENVVYNATYSSVLMRRIVFPPLAQSTLAAVVGMLILSTIVPILLSVRHASQKPTWRIY